LEAIELPGIAVSIKQATPWDLPAVEVIDHYLERALRMAFVEGEARGEPPATRVSAVKHYAVPLAGFRPPSLNFGKRRRRR
jgi:hypothetical protein